MSQFINFLLDFCKLDRLQEGDFLLVPPIVSLSSFIYFNSGSLFEVKSIIQFSITVGLNFVYSNVLSPFEIVLEIEIVFFVYVTSR